jgi:hypothetical protein
LEGREVVAGGDRYSRLKRVRQSRYGWELHRAGTRPVFVRGNPQLADTFGAHRSRGGRVFDRRAPLPDAGGVLGTDYDDHCDAVNARSGLGGFKATTNRHRPRSGGRSTGGELLRPGDYRVRGGNLCTWTPLRPSPSRSERLSVCRRHADYCRDYCKAASALDHGIASLRRGLARNRCGTRFHCALAAPRFADAKHAHQSSS